MQATDSELDILQVLWDTGEASVREIHEALSKHRQVGYTTTLKQVQRMQDKGMIGREGSGRSYTYHALIEEKLMKDSLTDHLMEKAFKGSAMDLAMHALGQSETSTEELDKLQNWLDTMRKEDKNG